MYMSPDIIDKMELQPINLLILKYNDVELLINNCCYRFSYTISKN